MFELAHTFKIETIDTAKFTMHDPSFYSSSWSAWEFQGSFQSSSHDAPADESSRFSLFKRVAMNKSFSRTQVQRQSQTLIERNDACNTHVLQDWSALRWSRITLLSDPAAKMIRMTVHVFSDSTLCVGVSNPDPTNIWVAKLFGVWNEHGFDEQLNLAARDVQFV